MNENQQNEFNGSDDLQQPTKEFKPLVGKIFQLRAFAVLGLIAAVGIVYAFMIMSSLYFEEVNLLGGIIVLTCIMLAVLSITTLVYSVKKTNTSFKTLVGVCIATFVIGVISAVVLYMLSPTYTILEMINILMPLCTLPIAQGVKRS